MDKSREREWTPEISEEERAQIVASGDLFLVPGLKITESQTKSKSQLTRVSGHST